MVSNPYKVLGVDSNTSLEDIRKAYRKLAKTYHPDSPTGNVVEFKRVKEAWEIIKLQKEGNNTTIIGSGVGSFSPVTHVTLFKFRRK